MGDSLARFRDLKGIGPATEARLHEAGIYTWEALAVAATALAAVRGEGDTLRDVANAVAARRAEAGERRRSCRPDRVVANASSRSCSGWPSTADGAPQRTEVTHVRTMAEQAWSGCSPGELATFIQEHSGVRGAASDDEPTRDDQAAPRSRRRRETAPRTPPSSDHLVVLDAGKAIGGASRDINLVVSDARAADGDFGYRATLAARELGNGTNGEGWTTVAITPGPVPRQATSCSTSRRCPATWHPSPAAAHGGEAACGKQSASSPDGGPGC